MIAALKHHVAHGDELAHELAAREWIEMDAALRLGGFSPATIESHRKSFETGIVIGYMHGVAAVLAMVEQDTRANKPGS